MRTRTGIAEDISGAEWNKKAVIVDGMRRAEFSALELKCMILLAFDEDEKGQSSPASGLSAKPPLRAETLEQTWVAWRKGAPAPGLSVEEARRRSVCRVCGIHMSATAEITLGSEHAHTACLEKERAG